MKIETDSLSGVAAESARGRSLAGIAMVLEETLVDVDWDRATAERMKKARATARLTFSTNRRWAAERARRDRAERRREKQTGGREGRRGREGTGGATATGGDSPATIPSTMTIHGPEPRSWRSRAASA
jgi:hypothetical protein